MPNVNLSVNPTAAVDASDWVGSGTRTLLTGLSGPPRTTGASVSFTTASYSASLGAGLAATTVLGTWTGVCWLRSSVARSVQVALGTFNGSTFVSANGYTGANTVSLTANTWTQVRALGTLTGSGAFTGVGIIVDLPSTGTAGVLSLSSQRMDNYSDSALTYADGATSGWAWDGTAHKSASRLITGPEPGRLLLAA